MHCAGNPNGEERLIACKRAKRCAGAGHHIRVGTWAATVTRRTTRYDIDFSKCIYCAFCEEACPWSHLETGCTNTTVENRGEKIMI